MEGAASHRAALINRLSLRERLLPFLKSCGYKEDAVRWLPAVGPSGQNLVLPPTEPGLAWWAGPTVVQAIDSFQPTSRAAAALPLRLPVADVFKGQRGGQSLGGKLEVSALAPLLWLSTLRSSRRAIAVAERVACTY